MDKFFIIGIRHNPQLGSYLSKTIVAKPKVNKASITAKFEEYGSSTSLRFSICPCSTDGRHYSLTSQECVYGGYEYIGFSDKAKAIAELQKWTNRPGMSSERAKHGISLFEAA